MAAEAEENKTSVTHETQYVVIPFEDQFREIGKTRHDIPIFVAKHLIDNVKRTLIYYGRHPPADFEQVPHYAHITERTAEMGTEFVLKNNPTEEGPVLYQPVKQVNNEENQQPDPEKLKFAYDKILKSLPHYKMGTMKEKADKVPETEFKEFEFDNQAFEAVEKEPVDHSEIEVGVEYYFRKPRGVIQYFVRSKIERILVDCDQRKLLVLECSDEIIEQIKKKETRPLYRFWPLQKEDWIYTILSEKSVDEITNEMKSKIKHKIDSDLTRLDGVGEKTAQDLKDAGYNTVSEIAAANPNQLKEVPGIGQKTAESILKSAQQISSQSDEEKSSDQNSTGTVSEENVQQDKQKKGDAEETCDHCHESKSKCGSQKCPNCSTDDHKMNHPGCWTEKDIQAYCGQFDYQELYHCQLCDRRDLSRYQMEDLDKAYCKDCTSEVDQTYDRVKENNHSVEVSENDEKEVKNFIRHVKKQSADEIEHPEGIQTERDIRQEINLQELAADLEQSILKSLTAIDSLNYIPGFRTYRASWSSSGKRKIILSKKWPQYLSKEQRLEREEIIKQNKSTQLGAAKMGTIIHEHLDSSDEFEQNMLEHGWEIVEKEKYIEIPLDHPDGGLIKLVGHVDAVFKKNDQQLVVDYKTRSDWEIENKPDYYFDKLQGNFKQLIVYQHYYDQSPGVLIEFGRNKGVVAHQVQPYSTDLWSKRKDHWFELATIESSNELPEKCSNDPNNFPCSWARGNKKCEFFNYCWEDN